MGGLQRPIRIEQDPGSLPHERRKVDLRFPVVVPQFVIE